MANAVLIIGQSGTGKSTSIRNLDPESTFIINVLDKPLPFRGFKKSYKPFSKENKSGNYYASDDWDLILRCIGMVDRVQKNIKTLIIDDMQYVLANEFMKRSSENGYAKYSEMGMHYWQIINDALKCRDDLLIVFMSHSELDAAGRSKIKTIGKLLDEKITIEGMFTTVLASRIIDGNYFFQTQSDNDYLAKSPMGLFEEFLIPNDLLAVKTTIESYFNDDDEE